MEGYVQINIFKSIWNVLWNSLLSFFSFNFEMFWSSSSSSVNKAIHSTEYKNTGLMLVKKDPSLCIWLNFKIFS